MKQKQLSDFPDYVRIRRTVDKLQTEEGQINIRLEEITAELSKPTQKIDGLDAWDLALEGKDQPTVEIDTRSSLREEYQVLEGRLQFIAEALKTGRMELDRVHGATCREICLTVRPQFVEQIGHILTALREICSANAELERVRNELEQANIRTDSIPGAVFDVGGPWEDPRGYGGRVPSYRKYVAEQFPELEPVKAKLKQFIEKTQSFGGEP